MFHSENKHVLKKRGGTCKQKADFDVGKKKEKKEAYVNMRELVMLAELLQITDRLEIQS